MHIKEFDTVVLANGTVGTVLNKRIEMEFSKDVLNPVEILQIQGNFGMEDFTAKDVIEIW